jgi:hypothetical protein
MVAALSYTPMKVLAAELVQQGFISRSRVSFLA